jgi:hypothetical protein
VKQPDLASKDASGVEVISVDTPARLTSVAPARLAGCCALLLALFAYGALHHGAIRSPDSEVNFRVCAALAQQGTFAVSEELPWDGFGLATGRDGQRFSIFGPLQPLLCAPWFLVVDGLSDQGRGSWLRQPPYPSHYVDGRLRAYLQGAPIENPEQHNLRALVSLFNIPVTLATVWALAWSLFPLVRRRETAWATALLFGLGTIAWHYAGTFFSEPLATLLNVLAFGTVVRCARIQHSGLTVLAGGLAGLAVTAHLSAVLFAPAWVWILACHGSGDDSERMPATRALLIWCLGFCGVLALLALFNTVRFGDPLETGRSIDMDVAKTFGYGYFVAPWRALVGLLASSSKGLFWYSPLVVLGLLCWRTMRARARHVSDALALVIVLRWLFIATRSDWHGGFALGPRLLVQMVPFALLPIALWLDENADLKVARRRWWLAASAGAAAVAQQAWFCLGEPMLWFHFLKRAYREQGLWPFREDRIYLDWHLSPLFHLDRGAPGPWWHPGPLAGSEPIATAVMLLFALLLLAWFALSRPRSTL